MKICDHCETEEELREHATYDLCLCEECWKKHYRRLARDFWDIKRLATTQKYHERLVLRYDYSNDPGR